MLTVAKNTAETFPNESGKIPVINRPEKEMMVTLT